MRYPAGGRDENRHFDGTSLKPRKLLKNAPTPTSRVHAVLGGLLPARDNVLHCFIIYQGFGVATSVASDDGVPSGVDDGITVGWDEIGVGGMPRI